jgi:hypothetical protein
MLRYRPRLAVFIIFLAFSQTLFNTSCGGGSKLSKDQLRIVAGDLRTFSLTSSLLAEERLKEHLTSTFFQSQATLLARKLEDSQTELNKPTDSLDEARLKALTIAGELSDTLDQMEQLNVSEGDPKALTRLGEKAKELEESLQEP